MSVPRNSQPKTYRTLSAETCCAIYWKLTMNLSSASWFINYSEKHKVKKCTVCAQPVSIEEAISWDLLLVNELLTMDKYKVFFLQKDLSFYIANKCCKIFIFAQEQSCQCQFQDSAGFTGSKKKKDIFRLSLPCKIWFPF